MSSRATINRKILIASHSKCEAITEVILNSPSDFSSLFQVVLLRDLLETYQIYDEVTDHSTNIHWFGSSVETVTNKTHELLNRVVYIPEVLFNQFSSADQSYALREFSAYLGFSLSAFKGVGNEMANGLCDNPLSLPSQYALLSKETNIPTPPFYWGPPDFNTAHNEEEYINKNIFNLTNWSTKKSVNPPQNHTFLVKRPRGNPTFIFVLGEKTFLVNNIELSTLAKRKIDEHTAIIQHCINYFLYEILFFVDGDDVVFGCVNHDIIQSKKDRRFSPFVQKHLINEYDKCKH